MGPLTESYANLSAYLAAQRAQERAPELLIQKFLRPLLPTAMRLGSGLVMDSRERTAGPFDILGGSDLLPSFGDGKASVFFSDGVVFCLQASDWAAHPLSDFGHVASQLKKVERRAKVPILCAAISFTPLPLAQLSEFLRGSEGQSVDAVLSLGEHVIVRNSGLYGDPQRIPFVTERGAGESLKAFALLLLQTSQTFLGLPFPMADYQHL
jgi:hypothetical protein